MKGFAATIGVLIRIESGFPVLYGFNFYVLIALVFATLFSSSNVSNAEGAEQCGDALLVCVHVRKRFIEVGVVNLF